MFAFSCEKSALNLGRAVDLVIGASRGTALGGEVDYSCYDKEKFVDTLKAEQKLRKTAGFSLSGLHNRVKVTVPNNIGHVDLLKNIMPRPGGKAKYKNSVLNPVKLKGKSKIGSLGAGESIRGANNG